MFGALAAGPDVVELAPDTKRLGRLTVTAGEVAELHAWVDGQGAGAGPATIRGVLYDAAGNLLATGSDVQIADGAAVAETVLPLPTRPTVGAGDVIAAVHAAPGGRRPRLHGPTFARPVRNIEAAPSFEAVGLLGWAGNSALSAVRSSAQTVGGAWSLQVTDDAAGGALWAYVRRGAPADAFPVGSTVRVQAKVLYPPGGLAVRARMFEIAPSGNVQADGADVVTEAGKWATVTGTKVITRADLTSFDLYIGAAAGAPASAVLYVDEVAITPGGDTTYVDGRQPGNAWDGAADASASRGPQGIVNRAPNPRAVGTFSYQRPGGASNTSALTTDPGGGEAGQDCPIVTALGNTGADEADYCIGTGTGTMTTAARVRVDSSNTYRVGVRVKAPAGRELFVRLTRRLGAAERYGTEEAAVRGILSTGDWQTIWATLPALVSMTRGLQQGIEVRAGIKKTPTAAGVALGATGAQNGDTVRITKLAVVEDPAGAWATFLDGTMPGASWSGIVDQSPTVLWQVPETADAYSDGAASTTGLAPPGPPIPTDLVAAVVQERGTAALAGIATLAVDGRPVDAPTIPLLAGALFTTVAGVAVDPGATVLVAAAELAAAGRAADVMPALALAGVATATVQPRDTPRPTSPAHREASAPARIMAAPPAHRS